MQHIRAAIATDDGKTCIERHFGDARYYDVYDVDERGAHFSERLENTVEVEEVESKHGDPRKASGIGGLLKKFQVNTAVAHVFGPNIKRIKKQFACVLVHTVDIPSVLAILEKEQDKIRQEIAKGEDRDHVDLRNMT